jgi:hypothetical protein
MNANFSHKQRRLRIANRIHLAMLRHLGKGIDVERMLKDGHYARDVLLVCDSMQADGLAGLRGLAEQFRATAVPAPLPSMRVWLQDSVADQAAGDGDDLDIDLSDFNPPRRPPSSSPSVKPWLWQPALRWLGA